LVATIRKESTNCKTVLATLVYWKRKELGAGRAVELGERETKTCRKRGILSQENAK
jgi:hypothetical protein